MQLETFGKSCAVLAAVLLVSACFAESGQRGGPVLSGTATAGTPLAGIVTIKDASTPSKQVVTTTRADGAFSADLSGMKAPFSLEASGPAGGASCTLHAITGGTGSTDINPLTEMAVAVAARGEAAALVYNYPEPDRVRAVAEGIPQALALLDARLRPLFERFGVRVDPETGGVSANHRSLESLFAAVDFVCSNNVLMVVNRASKGVIFISQVDDIEGGTFSAGNLPAAPAGSVT